MAAPITKSMLLVVHRKFALNFSLQKTVCDVFTVRKFPAGFHTSSIFAAKETIPFEYVKKRKPIVAEKSGDLEGLPQMDLTKPIYPLKESSELQKTEDETVKKIFSLEFAPRSLTTKAIKYETIERVRRHPFDNSSVEVQIAALTVRIRSLIVHTKETRKDSKAKMLLKELIERRTKRLKYLQKWDYERFEWLLKELNIIYNPHSIVTSTTRKITLREMTRAYCEDLRKARLTEYRKQLESERESFVKEKEDTMKWIQNEKIALGLMDSAQTEMSSADSVKDGIPTLMAEVARIAGETQSQSEQQ